MISHLNGNIFAKDQDLIYLDVNNLSYLIFATEKLFNKAILHKNLSCFIVQIFKEDGITLYGFEYFSEKIWFEYLIKIDGLGPKTAINIISKFTIEDIENAILIEDEKLFALISGIGKKIAARIIIEMKSKLKKINERIALFEGDNQKDNLSFKDNINLENKNLIKNTIEIIQTLGFNENNLYDKLNKLIEEFKCQRQEELLKLFLQTKDDKKQ